MRKAVDTWWIENQPQVLEKKEKQDEAKREMEYLQRTKLERIRQANSRPDGALSTQSFAMSSEEQSTRSKAKLGPPSTSQTRFTKKGTKML